MEEREPGQVAKVCLFGALQPFKDIEWTSLFKTINAVAELAIESSNKSPFAWNFLAKYVNIGSIFSSIFIACVTSARTEMIYCSAEFMLGRQFVW